MSENQAAPRENIQEYPIPWNCGRLPKYFLQGQLLEEKWCLVSDRTALPLHQKSCGEGHAAHSMRLKNEVTPCSRKTKDNFLDTTKL